MAAGPFAVARGAGCPGPRPEAVCLANQMLDLAQAEEDEEQADGEDRHDHDHEPLDRSLHQFDAPFVYEPFPFPRTQTIGRDVWMHPTLGGQYCHLPCRFRMTNDWPTPPPYQQPM